MAYMFKRCCALFIIGNYTNKLLAMIPIVSVTIIIVYYFQYHPNLEERPTSKARRPLSSDSALQKMDYKLIVNKEEQTRVGSPNVKKQFAIDRTTLSTDEEASSPMISAAKFYLSKTSKSQKMKINIKSNPVSAAMFSKTEKHSTPSLIYSILKKKEVVLTDSVFVMKMCSTPVLHDYILCSLSLIFPSTLLNHSTRGLQYSKSTYKV